MKIKILKTQEIFDTILPHSNQRIARVEVLEGKILNINQGDMDILFPKVHVGKANYYITDFSSERTKGFFHSGESRKIIVVNVSNFGYIWERRTWCSLSGLTFFID